MGYFLRDLKALARKNHKLAEKHVGTKLVDDSSGVSPTKNINKYFQLELNMGCYFFVGTIGKQTDSAVPGRICMAQS
jgi:hypothetical protein